MTAEMLSAFLTEIQTRVNHPLDSMGVHYIELKDPQPRQTRTKSKIGPQEVSSCSFLINDDDYTLLRAVIPANVTLKCIFIIEEEPAQTDIPIEDKPKKEPKVKQKKEPKTPAAKPGSDLNGQFFHAVYLGILRQDPKVCKALQIDELDEWDMFLRYRYNVNSSMREVTPATFIQDLDSLGLTEAKIKAENILEGLTKGPDPRGMFTPQRLIQRLEHGADSDSEFMEDNLLP